MACPALTRLQAKQNKHTINSPKNHCTHSYSQFAYTLSFLISHRSSIDAKAGESVARGIRSGDCRHAVLWHGCLSRSVHKDMSKMSAAFSTRAFDSSTPLSSELDGTIGFASPEGRPATTGIVLGVGIKELVATKGTNERTVLCLLVIPRRCPRRLCETQFQHHQTQRIPCFGLDLVFRVIVCCYVVILYHVCKSFGS